MKINNPLVSVLMTAYNRELYIAEAIESVLAQDYENFELIIVDDCSSDNTLEIAKSYQKNDSRIHIYENEKNLGDYPNRNRAASYAIGKYLKYLDADDVLYPNSINIMVVAMEKHPEAALGIQSNKIQLDKTYPILLDSPTAIRNHYLGGGVLLPGPSGVILKKTVFDKIGGFSGKRFVGDTECWIKIACLYDILILSPSIVWWREHDDQEIKKEAKDFEPVFIRYQIDQQYFNDPNFPLSREERSLIKNKSNRRFLLNIFKLLVIKFKFRSAIKYSLRSKMGFSQLLKTIFYK